MQLSSSLFAEVYPVSVTAGGLTTNTVNYTLSPDTSVISPAAAPVGTTVTISGTALGSSGSVSFNGVAAAVQSWSNTSVTTQVPSGATTGQVVLTTSGTQTGGINFQVLPPPNPLSSVTIQPATASLVVGETRTLLAVDNNGITITAATWSVDNTGLASISNDTPPVLTALATGTITLTATYQGVPGKQLGRLSQGLCSQARRSGRLPLMA